VVLDGVWVVVGGVMVVVGSVWVVVGGVWVKPNYLKEVAWLDSIVCLHMGSMLAYV
jgi:hypothetical protein